MEALEGSYAELAVKLFHGPQKGGGGSSDLINKNLHTNKATSTTEECKVYIKATYPLGKTTPDVH